MHPYLGMKDLISLPFSWMPCGRNLPMLAIPDSGRYGNISELTKRTLLTEFPMLFIFNDKISTKIIIFFDISLSLGPIGKAIWVKVTTG